MIKKLSLVVATLLMSTSLNAATVATVNGKNISDTEVAKEFESILRGRSFSSLSQNEQRTLVVQYVLRELIIEDAKKQNLEKDSFYIQTLEKAKEQVLVSTYEKKMFDKIKIDNAKIKSFYDSNKDKFVEPARVQARHILVENEKDAKDIINELKNFKGDELKTKFSEAAKTKSKDPGSATNGGELGWFDQNTMVKNFTDVAFSLKNGEMSKTPVKTNFGYHIILKENSQAKKQRTYDEVKDSIENALKAEELRKVMSQKGEELGKAAKVDIK